MQFYVIATESDLYNRNRAIIWIDHRWHTILLIRMRLNEMMKGINSLPLFLVFVSYTNFQGKPLSTDLHALQNTVVLILCLGLFVLYKCF